MKQGSSVDISHIMAFKLHEDVDLSFCLLSYILGKFLVKCKPSRPHDRI